MGLTVSANGTPVMRVRSHVPGRINGRGQDAPSMLAIGDCVSPGMPSQTELLPLPCLYELIMSLWILLFTSGYRFCLCSSRCFSCDSGSVNTRLSIEVTAAYMKGAKMRRTKDMRNSGTFLIQLWLIVRWALVSEDAWDRILCMTGWLACHHLHGALVLPLTWSPCLHGQRRRHASAASLPVRAGAVQTQWSSRGVSAACNSFPTLMAGQYRPVNKQVKNN